MELWEELEQSKIYKDFQSTTEKVLLEQWNDLVFSGVINDIYKEYKRFFVNRRGKRTKIRKADDTIRSVQDLKEQEAETQQGDRFLVNIDVLNMKAFLAFLGLLLSKNMHGFAYYYNTRQIYRKYLKSVMNMGGQSILEDIGVNYKFRLSNSSYKAKIAERVSNLFNSLDEVTKKRLMKQIIDGIKAGDTKTQLAKRLEKMGAQFSKSRAKTIAKTESQAALEYMRYESARLNGVKIKKWRTSRDERVCPICKPLDGTIISMVKPFGSFPNGEDKSGFSGQYPPAHPNCNCTVEYAISDNLCIDLVNKSKTIEGRIDLIKASVYPSSREILVNSCVNPNAIWAGGESLVGSDKQIGNYYRELKSLPNLDRDIRLPEYKNILSLEGYAQLLLKLGLGTSNL